MKRSTLLTSAALSALLTAGSASAQTIYPAAGLDNHAQPERMQVSAGYGGGFIEMLMTGNEPGRPMRRSHSVDPYPTARPGQRVDLTYDAASEDHSLDKPGRANPGTPGANGAVYPYQRHRQLASYAPVDTRDVPDIYRKQLVEYDGGQSPGTIIIDTPNKFLFLVQGDGKALRYGIGVGRPGFEWAGVKTVSRKAEWPGWTPPPEMLKRRPDLPRHMVGGPDNPLGARAMYLGSSLYRIHGTNEPGTIGQSVSSGCIRMTNDDVVDLYDRVRVGAKVIVR